MENSLVCPQLWFKGFEYIKRILRIEMQNKHAYELICWQLIYTFRKFNAVARNSARVCRQLVWMEESYSIGSFFEDNAKTMNAGEPPYS